MVALFAILLINLLDGDWRTGLIVTLMIGFLQDPLRKIIPNQPSQLNGLVLIGFVLCTVVLIERKGKFDLRTMFWTVSQMDDWVSIYFTLIALQAVNSFGRFSDPVLTGIGIAFYVAPALGMWVGFQVGMNTALLRRFLNVYLIGSAIFAISVFLSFRGFVHPLLKEVGEGLLITFRHGFSAQGASGLWRTSEIASWHLAAASCIAATVGAASRKPGTQTGLLLLSMGFALLTILTGRRKALVLVLTFAAIFLLLLFRRSDAAFKDRLVSNLLGTTGVAYVLFTLVIVGALGGNFGEFLNRTFTTSDDLGERVSGQGLGAILRAIEVSQFFGFGVGAGAQAGNVQVTANRGITSLGFVSEGGGGRVIVELGIPGLIVILILLWFFALVFYRNFGLLRYLPYETSVLVLGLACFGIANIPSFITAGQLYGDPFVLIMMSICLGSFLAVPVLAAQYRQQTSAAQPPMAIPSRPPSIGQT
ncbi:hypothetical protein NZK32_04185 [Cyanobium sp. FGCU-52]|nr:hypothetical protein [Cyanobium sp. FGCU52]